MVNNFDFDNRNADDPEVVEGSRRCRADRWLWKRIIRRRLINC